MGKVNIKFLNLDDRGKLLDVVSDNGSVKGQITGSKLKGYPVRFRNQVIPNELKILTKYGYDSNNIIGCDVSLGKAVLKVTLAELAELVQYLNCSFTVKKNGNKLYLAGNRGHSESEIKLVVLTSKKDAEGHPTALETQSKKDEKKFADKLSFISLVDFLKSAKGAIILPKDTKYIAKTEQVLKPEGAFVEENIGEICEPNIQYSSQLNCSLSFLKLGYVRATLSISDTPVKVPTFVYRQKIVYKDSINKNVERLGVAIPPTHIDVFRNIYGKFIKEEMPITDELNKLLLFGNKLNCVCFELDLNKIEVMLMDEAKNYLLSANNLCVLSAELKEVRAVKSNVRKVKSLIKEHLASVAVGSVIPDRLAANLKPFAVTIDDMRILSDLGIDLKYGSFVKTTRNESKSGEQSNTVKAKSVDTLEYKLEYKMEAQPTKLTQSITAKLEELKAKIANIVSADVLNILELDRAASMVNELESALTEGEKNIVKKLWLHKVASLYLGNKINFYDSSDWEQERVSAKNTSYKSKSAPGLTLRITSTSKLIHGKNK